MFFDRPSPQLFDQSGNIDFPGANRRAGTAADA